MNQLHHQLWQHQHPLPVRRRARLLPRRLHSHQPPKLFLGDGATEVIDIFVSSGTVQIRSGYMNISDNLVLLSGTGGGDLANGTACGVCLVEL